MLEPGDVVTLMFTGATGTKPRPAVVLSSREYHRTRPDVLVSLLTTQVARATSPTDYVLQDGKAAGLRRESAFRLYILTAEQTEATQIGKLSTRDWRAVRECCRRGLDIQADPPAL